GLPEATVAETQADRFRLFDAMASFLRNAARARPVVLVLDDLHAADEPSLLLLSFVAGVVAETRLLLVGTFRDLDPTIGDPLESTLSQLARGRVAHRIRLAGLTRAEVASLAELTAGRVPGDRLVSDLYVETE